VSGGMRWRALILIMIVDGVLPLIFMLVALSKGHISNWDMRERRERVPLYLFTLFVHGVGILVADYLGKGDLARILLVFWVVAVVFAMITTRWKISLHAGVNSVLVVFVNMIYGWRYWWLLGLIPLVAWARVIDRHHTWRQVLAGAVIGGGMVWVGMGLVV